MAKAELGQQVASLKIRYWLSRTTTRYIAMEKFYFTYGTDSGYPFRGGWTEVVAPSLKTAAQIFKIYHPNRDDADVLNCADYYRADEFEGFECFKNGNFGARCHEIIGAFTPEERR